MAPGSSAGCSEIELGGENYDVIAKFNGLGPAPGLGIKLATGANALDNAYRYSRRTEKWNHSSRRG